MKRIVWITGLLTLFGLAFLFGQGTQVSAQVADDGAVLTVEQSDEVITAEDVTLDDVTLDDATAGLGRGRRLPVPMCLRAAGAVLHGCPCAGPLGEDGKPAVDADGNRVPWENHGAYVACVTAKVNELKDKGLGEDCAAKLIARAGQSKVGETGFECPKLPAPVQSALISLRAMQAVAKACPCNGPDGNGWGEDGHTAYVACVTAKVGELVGKGMSQEVGDKIIKRAEESKIGTEGFQCPTPRMAPEPRIPERAAQAVAKACPCAGPLGADGKPEVGADGARVPWADHGAYLACVQAKVGELVGKGMSQEVGDKIIKRAEESKIGNADHQCPRLERGERPAPRPGPGPRPRR